MSPKEKETTPATAKATAQDNAKAAKAAAKALARAAKKAARPKLKTKSRKRPRAAQLSLDSNWKNMRGSDAAPRFPAKPNKHKRRSLPSLSDASDSKSVSVPKVVEQIKPDLSSLDANIVALDCEMVGVGYAKRSSLARVCVVDSLGHVLYDEHVKQKEKVTDFRTKYSGIRKNDLINARPFKEVQARVAELIKDKRLVGHGLENDFRALLMTHPKNLVRDTAHWRPLRKLNHAGKFRPRSLRDLTRIVLNKTIQGGEHNPHEDARSALEVYQKFSQLWEVFVSSGGKKMPGQLVNDPDGDKAVGVGGTLSGSARSSSAGDIFASTHKKRKV